MVALQSLDIWVYVPDDSFRNPVREAKIQRDLLKDYFNHLGALPGHYDRMLNVKRNYPGDQRSLHLSVIFKTTQLLQELLC